MHPLATTLAHAPSGRRDGDPAAVLAMAVALEQAAWSGGPRPSLAGKRIGLVCESLTSPEALAFLRAATELGAHVAHVRPSLSLESSAAEVSATLMVLGKLYDAVGFQGVPAELLARIGKDSGIPILKNIASVDHPSSALTARLDGRTSPPEARKFVLQAVMLLSLAGN